MEFLLGLHVLTATSIRLAPQKISALRSDANRMKRFRWIPILLLPALVLLTGCGAIGPIADAAQVVGAAVERVASPSDQQPAVGRASDGPPALAPKIAAVPALLANGDLTAFETALQDIYTAVNPSTVHVQVTVKQSGMDIPGLDQLPGLPDLPGLPNPFGSPDQESPDAPQEFYGHGTGSGFVWDKDGHIVTNNHVIENASKITVVFADGSQAEATVVGTDPDSDLAVLKVDVDAGKLQPVQLADSADVKVGQIAIAIGNPFGLENTMTIGFVSALGRLLPVGSQFARAPQYSIPDVIQTDAAINPGNSGGVLVDSQGRVIGVTAAIESPVRANAGVGFVIPSNIVAKVVPVLIKDGSFDHTWIGISGTALTPDLADAMKLDPEQRGALVVEVSPDSPADKAGLRGSDRTITLDGEDIRVGGDVIVDIDGAPIQAIDDVIAYLARSTEVGQTIAVTVLRDGDEKEIKIELDARPQAESETADEQPAPSASPVWLGIQGGDLTPKLAEAMKLSAEQEGVLVEQVEQGSPADEAGLRGSYKPFTVDGESRMIGGDVIVAIGDQDVTSMTDLRDFLGKAEAGQEVTLTVLRDGEQTELTVTLAERPDR